MKKTILIAISLVLMQCEGKKTRETTSQPNESAVEAPKALKLGDQAIDFKLPNLDGDSVALSDFRGKYVLLNFWKADCGACRTKHPYMLEVYQEYKDKGFEIVGVTMDQFRSRWSAAVSEDSITWTTVSDLKGPNAVVPRAYGVNYIPRNLLIDPEGVILLDDLSSFELETHLKELIGG